MFTAFIRVQQIFTCTALCLPVLFVVVIILPCVMFIHDLPTSKIYRRIIFTIDSVNRVRRSGLHSCGSGTGGGFSWTRKWNWDFRFSGQRDKSQHAPLKRWYTCTSVHGIISQEAAIITVMKSECHETRTIYWLVEALLASQGTRCPMELSISSCRWGETVFLSTV